MTEQRHNKCDRLGCQAKVECHPDRCELKRAAFAPAERPIMTEQRLTDEQIDLVWVDYVPLVDDTLDYRGFARAIIKKAILSADRGEQRVTKTLNELMVLANKYLAAHNSNDLTPARTNLESALRELIADAERKDAAKFWAELFPGGASNDDIQKELSDFHFMMREVPKVYMAITGGKLSKPNYHASTVIGEFEQYMEDCINDAVKEAIEDAQRTKASE